MLKEESKKILTNHLLDYIKHMEKLKELPSSGEFNKKELDIKITKYLNVLIDVISNT